MTVAGKVMDVLEGEDELGRPDAEKTTLCLQGLREGQPIKVTFNTKGWGFPSWQKGTPVVLEVEAEIVPEEMRIRYRPVVLSWEGLTLLRKEVFDVSSLSDPFSWLPLDAPYTWIRTNRA